MAALLCLPSLSLLQEDGGIVALTLLVFCRAGITSRSGNSPSICKRAIASLPVQGVACVRLRLLTMTSTVPDFSTPIAPLFGTLEHSLATLPEGVEPPPADTSESERFLWTMPYQCIELTHNHGTEMVRHGPSTQPAGPPAGPARCCFYPPTSECSLPPRFKKNLCPTAAA